MGGLTQQINSMSLILISGKILNMQAGSTIRENRAAATQRESDDYHYDNSEIYWTYLWLAILCPLGEGILNCAVIIHFLVIIIC